MGRERRGGEEKEEETLEVEISLCPEPSCSLIASFVFPSFQVISLHISELRQCMKL